ncbi:anti-sigma regulatory factor (Ser/Thr protein kinase) [Streptomyces sp. 3330]|uniref:ATP-binding protein/SpoIIE family protein phosphatase n=1 Tax=Streptomyces sp. 3330 TaxID=2817755 RepID=UPI00285BFE1E|nr:ATP-binding protein/SpoIIE family protein phosphatase [Streptomyces sp. 3330]MDR6974403.1 anti-sigma regulatory factor (Ser/Thr protein kinase) [Streptomyces sp. 3330]
MSRVWDIPVHDSTRIRDVRVATEAASARAGLGPHRTAVAALVATELATNLLKHAGGGRIVINLADRAPAVGAVSPPSSVQLLSLDHGPGISDVTVALRDGHTTAASLGAGLGTCLRTANDFDLHSTPGRGTVAIARIGHEPASARVRPGQHPPAPRAGGVNVPLARAEHSGDAWSWVRSGTQVTLMLADGLGHGERASTASGTAVEALRGVAHLTPPDILRHLHAKLRPTRGAAVAVAQLDMAAGQLCFAGVGNIGARLRTADTWQPLLSRPGIVGAHHPADAPVHRLAWRPDSLLILHSDGLPARWTPPQDPLLSTHDPAVVAAAVLRDAGSDARPLPDDTTVAVLAPDGRT